jgi:hypothetical protein
MGVLIQPRTLTTAAALVVARDGADLLSLFVAFVAFAVVSTSALLGILVYDIRRPERAATRLQDVVERLQAAGPLLFAILCGLAGGYLIVHGVNAMVS